jgi:hypothetical protein
MLPVQALPYPAPKISKELGQGLWLLAARKGYRSRRQAEEINHTNHRDKPKQLLTLG